jgi:hypothetical protein
VQLFDIVSIRFDLTGGLSLNGSKRSFKTRVTKPGAGSKNRKNARCLNTVRMTILRQWALASVQLSEEISYLSAFRVSNGKASISNSLL